MNPAWSNPPPPGIDMDEESKHSNVSSRSVSASILDQIDPYIKNPEYIKYKKSLSKERSHHRRSRSRSFDRHRSKSRDRRRRRRSRSRDRRRRSRSRSHGRRCRRYSSSSRSRSRSSSYERRHRHKKRRHNRKSRSRSRGRYHHKRSRRSRSHSHTPSELNDSFVESTDNRDDDEQDPSKENAFKNDGTFLEMFKKMQEEKEKEEAAKAAASTSEESKKPLPTFGKRRGGRVLKTGMVEKTKAQEDEDVSQAQDPWSIYLKEVKKYKEACCDDDSKTRPLVK